MIGVAEKLDAKCRNATSRIGSINLEKELLLVLENRIHAGNDVPT